MKTPLISNLNINTSKYSGKKEPILESVNHSKNLIGKAFQPLGHMAGLALLATVIGGPLLLSSCQPNEDMPTVVIDYTDSISTSLLNAKVLNIMKTLGGVPIVSKITPIMNMGFHQDATNTDYALKLSKDESSTKKLIYNGTKNIKGEPKINIRYTVTDSKNGIFLKSEINKTETPQPNDSNWENVGTYEFIAKSGDVVEQLKVLQDGKTEHMYDCRMEWDNIYRIPTGGNKATADKLSNFSALQY